MIPFIQPEPVRSGGMNGEGFNNRITKVLSAARLSIEIVKGLYREKDRVHAK
jgi:hypothetical protein